jgi:hypothetical protein
VAAEVLRDVQVLTMTTRFAVLDYATADAAHAAISSLITPGAAPAPKTQELVARPAEAGGSGEPSGETPPTARPGACPAPQPGPEAGRAAEPPLASDVPIAADDSVNLPGSLAGRDDPLVEAARQIVADAAREGGRLSQAALAERLRGRGWTIANDRLSGLAAAIGLSPYRRG